MLLAYSVAVLKSTKSVINKDRKYTFYRLEEEQEAEKLISMSLSSSEESSDFGETVHTKAKTDS